METNRLPPSVMTIDIDLVLSKVLFQLLVVRAHALGGNHGRQPQTTHVDYSRAKPGLAILTVSDHRRAGHIRMLCPHFL